MTTEKPSDTIISTVDSSKVFDLNGTDTLVKLLHSSKIVSLSSLFAEDISLSAEDATFAKYPLQDGGLVHTWHLRPIEINCPRMFSLNPTTAFEKSSINIGSAGFRWPCCGRGKKKNEASVYQSVGVYIPVLPPLANVLLEAGDTKVSERVLLEIAEYSKEGEKLLRMKNFYCNNGALRVGADPLEYCHRRPALCNSAENNSMMHYLRTRIHRPGSCALSLRTACELQVSLTQISLYDHPLFSPEDRLYAQMRLLYGEYHRYLKPQRVNYMRLKLQMLLDAVSRCRLKNVGFKQQECKLCFRCFQTLELMALEQQGLSELTEALYTT